MKSTKDGFILSTGRGFYANEGILGLSPDRERWGRLVITGGYDGGVDGDGPETLEERPFTPAERKEIAEYMAALWMEWAGLRGAVCVSRPNFTPIDDLVAEEESTPEGKARMEEARREVRLQLAETLAAKVGMRLVPRA